MQSTVTKVVSENNHTHCLRCGRKLKNEKAKQLGYGVICYKKIQNNKKPRLF